MITKAIIVEQKDNKYKIRIPIYHGIVGSANYIPDIDLPYATASVTSGIQTPYNINEIVYIAFEEEDLGYPIIIGSLHTLEEKINPNAKLKLSELIVDKNVSLPLNTNIANVKSNEIGYLHGTTKNIQTQFNDILNTYSTYNTYYSLLEFDQDLKWVLNSRGLLINSTLLDNTNEKVDSLNYIIPTIAQAKQTTEGPIESYPDTTTPGGPYTVYYSDASNKDRRLRLNWLGVDEVINDKVKISTGLYARNNWRLFPQLKDNIVMTLVDPTPIEREGYNGYYLRGGENPNYTYTLIIESTEDITAGITPCYDGIRHLAKPEYTWRPTIQGSTKSENLALANPLSIQSGENGLYDFNWYPYYLMLNPNGGDVELGRASKYVFYDNDKTDGSPTEGLKIKSNVDGTSVLITVEDSKLLTNGIAVGSGGSSNEVFTYYNEDDDETFISPYIPYYDNTETDTGERIFTKQGLLSKYATGTGDSSDLYLNSGYVSFRASIVLKVQATDLYYLPLYAEQSIQLKELLTLTSVPIRLDLSKQLSLAWNNLDFHFQIEITGSINETTDITTIKVKNITNYITALDLTNDNILSIYKARLLGPRPESDDYNPPTELHMAPAALNLTIIYQGNAVEGTITQSNIQEYGQTDSIE